MHAVSINMKNHPLWGQRSRIH